MILVPKSIVDCFILFRNKNTHYVVICDHIGDFLLTLGYLKAYREKNSFEHITICTVKKFYELLLSCEYKDAFDEIIVLEQRKLQSVLRLNSTNFGSHVKAKLSQFTIVNPANQFVEEKFISAIRYPELTLKDCIKYGCLGLTKDVKFYPPKLQEKFRETLAKKFQESKTVLLCPYSRFTDEISRRFFDELANDLKNNGYKVYTNLSEPFQTPVKGTIGIQYSLSQLYRELQKGGYVIGSRSGIMDLLMYTRCTIIALYQNGDVYDQFFRLSSLPKTQADAIEFKISSNYKQDIKKILLLISGGLT